jgi:hypothetical protein
MVSAGFQSSVGFGDVYGGRFGAAITGTTPTPNAAVAAGPGASTGAPATTQGNAPAIAWVGILVGLIVVRILYEMGGKID